MNTPPPRPSATQDGFNIVLVEPEIAANVGNIARLCAATRSVLHLIHPLGFRLEDAAMRRAGMDYLDIATIVEHSSLHDCLSQQTRAWFFSTKATRLYWQAAFQKGDCLVFGRETKGLPEELLRRKTDHALTIPMTEPRARSLNLATSTGIALYEAIRQTKTSHP
ncbi:MAG: tRNA (cytidine(34)-2'-O)-methyltransferase [Verrucomicrobiae bacterium]|nr:tRNA (cytidine(34)-2'-O)-methyltransferase [Verrucomicrobiae bacterium]